MELQQLHYFMVVARHENVTRAAEELHIAQPSLSKTIINLENELKIKLFDRVKKRIILNDNGKKFQKRVRKIFFEINEANKELCDSISTRSISVGLPSSQLLQRVLTNYFIEHKNRKFSLAQTSCPIGIVNKIFKGELDICFSFEPIVHPDICCQQVATERILIAVNSEHPLAQNSTVNLASISEESFISLTSECGLRALSDSLCLQTGFTPKNLYEINSLDVIISLVGSGLGIAFIPEFLDNKKLEIHNIKLLQISEPIMSRTIWVAWHKSKHLSAHAKEFCDFSINYFSKYI